MDLHRRGQAGGDHGRMRNSHQNGAPDPIREGGQNAVQHGRPPVLTDQVAGVSVAEGVDQADNVQRQGRPVVEGFRCDLAGRIAAQEGGDGPEAGRSQRRHLMFPGPGVVGIAVQQQNQRTLAGLQIRELHSVRADAALLHDVDSLSSLIGRRQGLLQACRCGVIAGCAIGKP